MKSLAKQMSLKSSFKDTYGLSIADWGAEDVSELRSCSTEGFVLHRAQPGVRRETGGEYGEHIRTNRS